MAAGGPGRREEMAPPSPYVHSMPAWVLEDFCQKMDCLSDGDWMRFGERGSPAPPAALGPHAALLPHHPVPRLPASAASAPRPLRVPRRAARCPPVMTRCPPLPIPAAARAAPPVQPLPSAATTGR